MSVDPAFLALGLTYLCLACAAPAPDRDGHKGDDVPRPIQPDWGPSRAEYKIQTLGHSGSNYFARVAVYEKGSICFLRRTATINLLDARFDLGQLHPRDWALDRDVGQAALRFEWLKSVKELEEAGARDPAPVTSIADNPCVVIDVYADPREGASHSDAVALGEQRGRLLEERIRTMTQVKEVKIRSHGWRDTAIENASERSWARARIQVDPTCTFPKPVGDEIHLDVYHGSMNEIIAFLHGPISSLTSTALQEPGYPRHSTTRTFTWSPSNDGAATPTTPRRLLPADCGAPREDQRNRTTDSDSLGRELDPRDACIVEKLEEFFTEMLNNGCEPQAAGM
jgi:hypothetical protein